MRGQGERDDSFRSERRKIMRRATFLVYGYLAIALVLGIVGGAVVAWLLSRVGFPFRETWIVATLIVIGVPLIGLGVGALRERFGSKKEEEE